MGENDLGKEKKKERKELRDRKESCVRVVCVHVRVGGARSMVWMYNLCGYIHMNAECVAE